MITFKNFNYKYTESEKLNIDSLSLDIKKGECVLFTGNSGSGKTTILRVLNGLAPEFFSGGYSGELKVLHLNIGDRLREFSKIVGSVFQNPKNQFFNLDSTSELAFSMENYGYSREKIQKRIDEVISEFSAEHLLDRNVLELSGGEKQKLAFMASMMLDADIYVLDEITSNLDLKAIKLISTIIQNLKKSGKTVIIAEHRIYYLKDLIDRMYIVKDGKVIHSVSKEELNNFDGRACQTRQIDLNKVELVTRKRVIDGEENYLMINSLSYKVNKKNIEVKQENFSTSKVYAIIGDNGCGKTTFANALSGLSKIKYNIELAGEAISKKGLLKNTFQVMQDVNYQLFTNLVDKEIKLGCNNIEMFDKIVDSLGIRKLLGRHPNTLSGGEKQRVAIASALLSKKKILIFDEPTSGLDYINMIELSKLIHEIGKSDVVIFIITHDYEFLCTVADEVLHFDENGIRERIDLNVETKEKILKIMS
ncbi:ABC transporter, ATP-binding protein [Gemella bergeri ATCC 700627]|uniref:ABC transporter, ATP-binding protein n=1 Tax=Gemella bergeri ATCC 700627 TaxID=1321820 RepID=U2QW17_9BACL|nr:ABC transporter ATP-binding protein [Gemella bergeri]ERK60409.1 ABC transporter, ATP-binding protein [Gemella bergeri ATCC 700627]